MPVVLLPVPPSWGDEKGNGGTRQAEESSEVRFLITGQYLDIYKLLNQNIDLTEKVLQNMKNRFKQGTALKNDITRYELQLEMLCLQQAKVKDACKILNLNCVPILD